MIEKYIEILHPPITREWAEKLAKRFHALRHEIAEEMMVEYSDYVDKTMNRNQKRGPLVIPLGYGDWLNSKKEEI